MAAGDLGPVIDTQDCNINGGDNVVKVNNNVALYAVDFARRLQTWAIDGAYGISGAFIDEQLTNGVLASTGVILPLNANSNFVFFYYNSAALQMEVYTFHVSDAGIITPIATFNYGGQDFLRDAHKGNGNIYITSEQISVGGFGMAVRTFSISDDGITIALIDSWFDFNIQNNTSCIEKVYGDVFLALRADLGAPPGFGTMLRSFRIPNTGIITLLHEYQLDTVSAFGQGPQVFNLYPATTSLCVVAWRRGAGVCRLVTFNAFTLGVMEGLIGPLLDLDDAVLPAAGGDFGHFWDMGAGIVVVPIIAADNKMHIITVPVTTLGIIGAAIDDFTVSPFAVTTTPKSIPWRNQAIMARYNDNVSHSILATITADVSYHILVTVIGEGTVVPGSTDVLTGASQNFVFTPAPGYATTSVLVDGVAVPVAGSYLFSNIIADHTLAVTFTAIQIATNGSHAESREPLPK